VSLVAQLLIDRVYCCFVSVSWHRRVTYLVINFMSRMMEIS